LSYFYIEWQWLLWFYDHPIHRSGAIIVPYALTIKSDLELFSLVTSSDKAISIFRGYNCTYQFAGGPFRHGIVCEKSGKQASQRLKAVSKQKHKCAKHFGWHWLLRNLLSVPIMVQTSESVNKIFSCDHSIKSSSAVLCYVKVCFTIFLKRKH